MIEYYYNEAAFESPEKCVWVAKGSASLGSIDSMYRVLQKHLYRKDSPQVIIFDTRGLDEETIDKLVQEPGEYGYALPIDDDKVEEELPGKLKDMLLYLTRTHLTASDVAEWVNSHQKDIFWEKTFSILGIRVNA